MAPYSPDPIFDDFLRDARATSQALFDQSDLVAGQWDSPQHLRLRLSCRGLIRTADGRIQEHDDFTIGIHLPSHYLTWVDPMSVLTVMSPHELFQPNVRAPVACIGPIEPGELIDSLIYRVFDLVGYGNFTTDERNALSFDACRFARRHMDEFPVENRPLLYRHADGHEDGDRAAARPMRSAAEQARVWGSA